MFALHSRGLPGSLPLCAPSSPEPAFYTAMRVLVVGWGLGGGERKPERAYAELSSYGRNLDFRMSKTTVRVG